MSRINDSPMKSIKLKKPCQGFFIWNFLPWDFNPNNKPTLKTLLSYLYFEYKLVGYRDTVVACQRDLRL